WKSPQERVDMMRQALAEFPAEEKLLFKLAKALYYKWCEYGTTGTWLNGYHGYTQENFNEHRSHDSWEESVKIMEELLLTSVDDQMRSECRQLLAFIYGKIGKKEKLLAILDKCEGIWTCKEVLSAGAMHGYFEDSVKYQQNALVELLGLFKNNITSIARFEVKDINITLRTYEIIIDLYNLVYCDGNFVFYNLTIADLYREYAEILLKQDRVDEAFEVLEKAYAHVKTFDDEVYKKGVIKYTSPFVNFLENNSNENYVVKNLPIFLENLKETTGMYNLKKLYDDPRYTALINKIEKEINEGSE
ncbi:MAG: hypothetical protein FWF15_10720, partial [Oscillospiraceae bacterium]|nr:hypothetical protein [Oscillospiraceae bacterium]